MRILKKTEIPEKSIYNNDPFPRFTSVENVWAFVNELYANEMQTNEYQKRDLNREKCVLASGILFLISNCNPADYKVESIIRLLDVGLNKENLDDETYKTTLDRLMNKYKDTSSMQSASNYYYDLFRSSSWYRDRNEAIMNCIMKLLPFVNYEFYGNGNPLYKSPTEGKEVSLREEALFKATNGLDADNLFFAECVASGDFFDEDLKNDSKILPAEPKKKDTWFIGNEHKLAVTAKIETQGQDVCLIISGSGATENYSRFFTPWYNDYHEQITKVIVEDGITRLGDGLFSELIALREATIAGTVSNIGDNVFHSCYELRTITFKEVSYEEIIPPCSIGEGCFTFCKSLEQITLPGIYQNIGDYSFYGCESLKCFRAGENIKFDKDSPFKNCPSLEEVEIYDIKDCLKHFPYYIQELLKPRIEFKKCELWSMKEYLNDKNYHIENEIIYLAPYFCGVSFADVLKAAVAEYLYETYFKEFNKTLKHVFLKFRFDLLKEYACSDDFRKDQVEAIFANEVSVFKYYFFRVPIKGAMDYPLDCSLKVKTYAEGIKRIHNELCCGMRTDVVLSMFYEMIGEEGEKILTYKMIREKAEEYLKERWTDAKVLSWIRYLIEKGLITRTKSSNRNSHLYAIPKTET